MNTHIITAYWNILFVYLGSEPVSCPWGSGRWCKGFPGEGNSRGMVKQAEGILFKILRWFRIKGWTGFNVRFILPLCTS